VTFADIVANLKLLIWEKRYNDKWVWLALVLRLFGLIPVLGSMAKGILKIVAEGPLVGRLHKGPYGTTLTKIPTCKGIKFSIY